MQIEEDFRTHNLQPRRAVTCGLRIPVQIEQKTSEEQTEQHDKATDQVCHSTVFERDPDRQAYRRGSKIEEHKNQDEFEEYRPFWQKTRHWINDDAHNNGWKKPKWYDVKQDFCREISDGRVITIGALANEQEALGRENGE